MWEKTVMSDEEIDKFLLKLYENPKLFIRLVEFIIEVSKQGGIRKVVEWVNKHKVAYRTQSLLENPDDVIQGWMIFPNEWQEKLKEWGIKEEQE